MEVDLIFERYKMSTPYNTKCKQTTIRIPENYGKYQVFPLYSMGSLLLSPNKSLIETSNFSFLMHIK
jgi:hypothetical protein